EVEHERFASSIRSPIKQLRHDLGPIVVGTPTLHELCAIVDDPVLGHAIALIDRALSHAIGPRRARRDDLGGQQQSIDNVRSFAKQALRNDENVRLQYQVWRELDIERRQKRLADSLRADIWMYQNEELRRDSLVSP